MSLKEIIDAVSTLGTLGFALLAVYAFLTERIVPRSRLDEQRADKKEAMELARDSIRQQERLADAVEARNQLDQSRVDAAGEATMKWLDSLLGRPSPEVQDEHDKDRRALNELHRSFEVVQDRTLRLERELRRVNVQLRKNAQESD